MQNIKICRSYDHNRFECRPFTLFRPFPFRNVNGFLIFHQFMPAPHTPVILVPATVIFDKKAPMLLSIFSAC